MKSWKMISIADSNHWIFVSGTVRSGSSYEYFLKYCLNSEIKFHDFIIKTYHSKLDKSHDTFCHPFKSKFGNPINQNITLNSKYSCMLNVFRKL